MNENKKINQQDFVKQDTALESMRESDFDCYSAYGEAIDNSIQANANDIRLKFVPKGGAPGKIGQLIFADNGSGMDKELLNSCLKLGHSSRYNDRDGIGRFGVGMTLGAIHECRRVEVYSKFNDGIWLWTYIDLDEIKNESLKFIPEPIEKDPSADPTIGGFGDFIEKSGTILVWRKYDRQIDNLNNIVEETKFWIGRTFRRFIWGNAKGYDYRVQLMVNGDIIKPFDPLFVEKELTGFEDEPSAELLKAQTIKWPIPEEVLSENPNLGATSDIEINVSLLPDEYRRERFMGGDDFAMTRGIDRNEGVSIMRSDREVFYGHIPHASRLNGNEGDRNLTRFIGCVIDFNPVLDREFEVKNIKRGCVPTRDLKVRIIEALAPTFKTQREKIRERWSEVERIKNSMVEEENEGVGIHSNHSNTISTLKKAGINQKVNESKNKTSEEGNKPISKKINPNIKDEDINKLIAQLKENGVTIVEREFIGDSFIDIEHGNGLKTMIYNTNSEFYKNYSRILDALRDKNRELADDYKVLIDLIFVGYLLAEANIDPNKQMNGIDFINDMRLYWSRQLRDILRGWE